MFWYVLQIYKSSSAIIIAHVVSCVCLSVYIYYFESSWISHCVFDIYLKYSYYTLCYCATLIHTHFNLVHLYCDCELLDYFFSDFLNIQFIHKHFAYSNGD